MISSNLLKELTFIFYRFRHVIIYTLIGFFSILCELIIRKFLIAINIGEIPSTILSITFGILKKSLELSSNILFSNNGSCSEDEETVAPLNIFLLVNFKIDLEI